MNKKAVELALGAEFVYLINSTIQSVKSGTASGEGSGLGRDVQVITRGCQLRPADLEVMIAAARITLDQALNKVSGQQGVGKEQMVAELWPGGGSIPVTFTMTPDRKFVWSLDLD